MDLRLFIVRLCVFPHARVRSVCVRVSLLHLRECVRVLNCQSAFFIFFARPLVCFNHAVGKQAPSAHYHNADLVASCC